MHDTRAETLKWLAEEYHGTRNVDVQDKVVEENRDYIRTSYVECRQWQNAKIEGILVNEVLRSKFTKRANFQE